MDRIRPVQGDITTQAVAAIVNAANETLLGGGGVDGAIHRAAGPDLLAFCRSLGGCRTGAAKITPGFGLPAKWIIHTVGPIWRGGDAGEDDLLASCYHQSMALAARHGAQSVAFPQIATGAYGFPIERACRIALTALRACLERYPDIAYVNCVSFDAAAHAAMTRAWTALRASEPPFAP